MRVLIANRGEIVARVIHSCHELDIEPVAIYTDVDAQARLGYLDGNTEAVRVESYLDAAGIVAAAQETGASAVHPGYGFLSESADFAEAVIAAGLTWIGPPPSAMRAMARKDHAREIAERAGVPVTPRYQPDAVPAEAYPVLVKAAAGGGGKGMHVVRTPAELPEALTRAAREAGSAFGDDTLLVERYVEGGRHVEVQVVGLATGEVVHFGTRDCSAQRRHQKVVEEAPATDLPDELRELLHRSAVALATEVGYRGAGTVEFLVHGQHAYFLEMNTRLQVEHPVTEEVYDVDLVQLQLEVAGLVPAETTTPSAARGHAIEARIYAEDAYAGFLPQAGTLTGLRLPRYLDVARVHPRARLRIETALTADTVVGTSYDPMLAKLVVWGPDREVARRALIAALDEFAVEGVVTNAGFVRALVASEEFRDGEVHTGWLDEHPPVAPDPGPARQLAARHLLDRHCEVDGPWASDGFRLGGPPAPVVVQVDVPVEVTGEALDGEATSRGRIVEVRRDAQSWRFEVPDPFDREHQQAGDGTVTSPMPGTVLEVRVSEGQSVQQGDVLAVLEAMKMELSVKAPLAGRVDRVAAAAGDQVALGAALFEIGAGDE
ncbi:acetyl/propionyl/methylcrotonyl-CoA carboxylase subunit alpha [Nocardioides sp.]|uniref:acetyl/propionyl/methylcrotonyl-CoA carboxylase subunit alpha n=1 Tax=Nocardioides sp. TaxID=35761 RepID=UPI0039E69349